jgi:hypothetical protein
MDRPFIYVFDADALVDGANYNDLTVPLHMDSEFRLRRIAGRPAVNAAGGLIQVRGDGRRQLFSAPSHIPPDQAVVPELVYAPGSAITIDLTNVLRANNATTGTPVYWSQLCFQGVRRFAGPEMKARETTYRYQEKPFAIVVDMQVTWSGRLFPGELVVAGGRQFNAPVQDYDFELYYIALTEQLVGVGPAVQPSNQSIKLMLYDVDGNQLMSAPVCDFFLGAGSRGYNSLFPIPPLVYPAGSQILFDIHSLLANASLPMNLELAFCGVRRMPC